MHLVVHQATASSGHLPYAESDAFANPLAKESCGRGLFSASMSWSPETILAALVLANQGRFTRPIPTPSVLRVTMHWGWAICRDRIAGLGPPTAFRGSRLMRTRVQCGRKITSATHMSCRWLAENDRLANPGLTVCVGPGQQIHSILRPIYLAREVVSPGLPAMHSAPLDTKSWVAVASAYLVPLQGCRTQIRAVTRPGTLRVTQARTVKKRTSTFLPFA